MLRLSFLVLCGLAVLISCSGAGPERAASVFEAWVTPIEVRVYRGAFSRTPEDRAIRLEALAGEYASAQVVVRSNRDLKGLSGSLTDLAGPAGTAVPAGAARVRPGAFLPVDETMTMTADPLLETPVDVPANLAQPVWLTFRVPREAQPGQYSGKLTVADRNGSSAEFEVSLEVLPAVLADPPDWSFYLNIWQDPSGVARAHKVKVWSEEHWKILERYARNFGEHGMKSIMTSIIHDPWKAQSGYEFDTMVEWKYPGEYQVGQAAGFTWDFTVFDRYAKLMLEAGIRDKIDMYALVMGPGSTLDANVRYLDTTTGSYRTKEIQIGDEAWREVWKAFLPVLKKHLKEKGWFDIALLGFDEKPERIMKLIFDFIIETDPEFKIVSSGGYPGDERKWGDEIVFHIDDLLNRDRWQEIEPVVKSMHADPKKFISWYTACMPYFPNTYLFSRLRESRLIGWLTWKYGFDGYTRWAVNAFPEDVWDQPNYKWHSGDMYFVYPGDGGPLDGMRWELMRQGIQDYEALRIAWEMAKKAGRSDLVDKLEKAVGQGTIIDSCGWIPYCAQARAEVNAVIRELGGKG